jgi:hypothetical protein
LTLGTRRKLAERKANQLRRRIPEMDAFSRAGAMTAQRILRFAFAPLLLTIALPSVSVGTTWSPGQFVAYNQNQWGDNSSPAYALLAADFGTVYFSNGGAVLVGEATPPGFAMVFESAVAIDAYLPQAGTPDVLDRSLLKSHG